MNRKLAACVALAVGSLGVGPAAASGSGWGHGGFDLGGVRVGIGGASCGAHAAHAGVLLIDGCRTTIRSGHWLERDILLAFRRAGYEAWCRDGRVTVRFGCRRPSVRWYGDGARVRLSFAGDCLILTTWTPDCSCGHGRGRGGHGGVRIDVWPDRGRDPGWRHDRWPRRSVCR